MAWQFLGSLLAIAAMIAVVAFLSRGTTSPPIDESDARESADHAFGGFSAAEAIIDQDAGVALLAADDGRLALLHRHGAHLVPRLLGHGTRVDRTNGRLSICAPDSGKWQLDLPDDAGTWEKRISALS